jgi:hypothetical protein
MTTDSVRRSFDRLLRTTLPDDAARQRVVREALYSAKRAELPTTTADMLEFVNVHVRREVLAYGDAKLLSALLDDFLDQIQHERNDETVPTVPLPAAPFPRLKQSVDNLDRTLKSTEEVATRRPVPPSPQGTVRASNRTLALVADHDLYQRSTLSRALIRHGFDVVSVRVRVAAELTSTLKDPHESLVVIGDWDDDGALASALRTLSRQEKHVYAVIRSAKPQNEVERMLRTTWVERVVVVPPQAETAEVVASVRRLVGA